MSPRADAVRNRERVLVAARDAFAADGPRVSLENVARRAGVGAGTVHRHFPSKSELLAAVVADRMRQLADAAESLADAPDPGAAFFAFFARLSGDARENLALAAAVTVSADVGAAGAPLDAALSVLLSRAQRAGQIRADIGVTELHAIMAGALLIEQRLEPASAGLGLRIVADGLRAQAPAQNLLDPADPDPAGIQF